MILSLLQIALVLSNTFVISAYASGLEPDSVTDPCKNALTQYSDEESDTLFAIITEFKYITGEYNKIAPSVNGYSDEQKTYAIELIEAFDGDNDISIISILLDIPEVKLNSWLLSAHEKKAQAMVDKFHQVSVDLVQFAQHLNGLQGPEVEQFKQNLRVALLRVVLKAARLELM